MSGRILQQPSTSKYHIAPGYSTWKGSRTLRRTPPPPVHPSAGLWRHREGQAYRTPKEASAQTNSCRLAPLGGQISLGGVVDSQARGQVLPLLGGRLDYKQAWQIRGGNQGQGVLHHLFGCVRREVSPAAGVQRDFDASAAPGLYVGMQKGAPQMVVRAVDIVG